MGWVRIDEYMESIRTLCISLSQLVASMSAHALIRRAGVAASTCTSTWTRTIEIEA